VVDRTPVILDTDIGSDIDDAVCLSYLLKQPRCELVGISTVSGSDPRERASLADAVCRAADRTDIPIHSGAACRPDTGAVVQPGVPQAAVLGRFPHRKPAEFRENTAVHWLHETISKRPGEITLLAIGPMTNVALLFAMDPSIARKLKRLVLMCGVFTNHLPRVGPLEWNALCDPWATHVVYRTVVAGGHLSIGLDVTMQVQMPTPECIAKFKSIGGPLGVVSAMTEVWGSHADKVTFHDPLAATVIFKPEICTYESVAVSTELKSDRLQGMTQVDWKAAQKPHQIAVGVDAKAFFAEYFGITGG
jgi:purine nucleosidase